jgi:hypothetical protein
MAEVLLRSPVNLTYDTSNGHHYIYTAEILYGEQIVQTWPTCWPTLGLAQAFWAPQIDGHYKHTVDGWIAELKGNLIAYMKGHTVRIRTLVVFTR